ncbi:unnamed protein product [Bursaphelenchus xylophilus]|uniref:(pine wood nematode) hypothetical protein n=1 Tax=Bursaphelenchus xylophilus TaxID=6326 RepID=A0A1I7S7L3_BURXY|nr:unnamed protein product [Bursaphelenchus xylophilus]CAG9111963.1 unnamed protein product [Bursaphelenchus xylophilus]
MWSGLGFSVLCLVLCVVIHGATSSSESRQAHLPYQLPGAYNLVADKLDPKVLEMELAGQLPVQEKPEPDNDTPLMSPVFEGVEPPPVPRRQVCWCCRAYVCHYQRCPCSKFML